MDETTKQLVIDTAVNNESLTSAICAPGNIPTEPTETQQTLGNMQRFPIFSSCIYYWHTTALQAKKRIDSNRNTPTPLFFQFYLRPKGGSSSRLSRQKAGNQLLWSFIVFRPNYGTMTRFSSGWIWTYRFLPRKLGHLERGSPSWFLGQRTGNVKAPISRPLL